MSVWIRAICRQQVNGVSATELKAGIEQRIELVTYLFGEDDPDEIIAGLEIHELAPLVQLRRFRLYYGEDQEQSIFCESWTEGNRVQEEVDELLGLLENREHQALDLIRNTLEHTVEIVGFELKGDDVEREGWPLAIAAAAFFADRGKGLIYAEGDGWYEPARHDVTCLFNEE